MKNTGLAILKDLEGPVLITGHTGFKGTWLTRYLVDNKVRVVGYSLPPKDTDLYFRAGLVGNIDEQFADIRRIDEFGAFVKRTKPSAIFHLAAQPLVLESYRDPLTTFETNVMGTANVLEIARKSSGVRAVVVVTTDKVYQNLNSGIKFKESDPLLGVDPYSASKVGTENVVIAWQNLQNNGIDPNISVVRSGNVVGGGDLSDDRLLADIVRAHVAHTKLKVRNPKSTRPWQHVLDPLNGYVMAMEQAIQLSRGNSFNFGPSEPALEVGEVIKIAQEHWEDLEIEVTVERERVYESRLLDLDSSYARENLLWSPKYSQKEAIKETLKWWDHILGEKMNVLEAVDIQIRNFSKQPYLH